MGSVKCEKQNPFRPGYREEDRSGRFAGMAIRVRVATVEDAAAIARVQVASWQTTYLGIVPREFLAAMDEGVRERAWREQLETGHALIFVAEEEAEVAGFDVIGFIGGGALREAISGYDSELYAVYLVKKCQGIGVGRVLVRELARRLRADGFGRMVVWVLEENPAVGFYKRLGARAIAGKMITIAGVRLAELGLGWDSLDGLA